MTDKERDIARLINELTQELVRHHGDVIQNTQTMHLALAAAIESLQRTNETVARLSVAVGELVGPRK
jgi:hypothetical protein